MYGSEIGLPATGVGGGLAFYGLATGTTVLALTAAAMITFGLVMLLVNHFRRGGARP